MNIVNQTGGLANQIRIYVMGRYLEILLNYQVHFNTSLFTTRTIHNGFELDRIFPNIKLNLLENHFNKDDLEVILKESKKGVILPVILSQLDYKFGLIISSIGKEPIEEKFNEYGCEVYKFDGNKDNLIEFLKLKNIDNIYYHGYWSSPVFFNEIKKEMLYELEFPPIPDEKNKYYYNLIKETHSVGIHVRRGDFVGLDWALSPQAYQEAITNLRQKIVTQIKNPVFFIITDDPQWCKENRKEMGFLNTDEVIYIDGNTTDAKNYIDMQLLSHCKYIISNSKSSFSQVAGWLNQNLIERIRI